MLNIDNKNLHKNLIRTEKLVKSNNGIISSYERQIKALKEMIKNKYEELTKERSLNLSIQHMVNNLLFQKMNQCFPKIVV